MGSGREKVSEMSQTFFTRIVQKRPCPHFVLATYNVCWQLMAKNLLEFREVAKRN
jgi:hypothetical protein